MGKEKRDIDEHDPFETFQFKYQTRRSWFY